MFYFLQRCQQFTGPLAAKGVEDTSFYIYNRLISHNEVGDSPENFGITVKDFHERMIQRKKIFRFQSMPRPRMTLNVGKMQECG